MINIEEEVRKEYHNLENLQVNEDFYNELAKLLGSKNGGISQGEIVDTIKAILLSTIGVSMHVQIFRNKFK